MKFDSNLHQELKKSWEINEAQEALAESLKISSQVARDAIVAWIYNENHFILNDSIKLYFQYDFISKNIGIDAIVNYLSHPCIERVKESLPKRDCDAFAIVFLNNIKKIQHYDSFINRLPCLKNEIALMNLEDFSNRLKSIFHIFNEICGKISWVEELTFTQKMFTCSNKKLHEIFKEVKNNIIKTVHGESWTNELSVRDVPDAIIELGFTQFKNIKNIYEWSVYAGNCIYASHLDDILNDLSMLYLKNEKEGITLQLKINNDGSYSIIEIKARFNENVDPAHPIFKILG